VKVPKTNLETSKWPRRPRFVQFNAGRLELSVPYAVVITACLLVVLFILIGFRLGQAGGRAKEKSAAAAVEPVKKADPQATDLATAVSVKPETVQAEKTGRKSRPKMVEPIPSGDHIIVLVQYPTRADLVPVRQYYADNGIETEIIFENGWYFLVTKNRYRNPNREDTDGYRVKQRIIKLGSKYKAPTGHETFAPNLFRDAYGKKVKN